MKCGFSRTDITPDTDIPLDGMGNNTARMPNLITGRLTASFIAVSDGESAALLCTMDVLWIHRFFYEKASELISERTGIPVSSIFISATHIHSGPDMRTLENRTVSDYLESLYSLLPETAMKAVEDMSECELYTGRCQTRGLNSVRRYFMENGKLLSVGVTDSAKVIFAETEGDHTLQAAEFRRKGKKDVVLVNFAAHPDCGPELKSVHPSYIGVMRTKAEEAEDLYLAFFQGAQGNMEAYSRVPELSAVTGDKSYTTLGYQLAGCFRDLRNSMKKQAPGKLRMVQQFVSAEVDHSRDGLLDQAKELSKQFCGNIPLPDEIRMKYGLHASTDVNKVITNATVLKDVQEREIPVGALAIGDTAFVFAGYEMFTQSGMQIKTASPFSMTFICGNSCGSNGYLPAEECFPNYGFEVNSTTFVRGTAEKAVRKAADILYELLKF